MKILDLFYLNLESFKNRKSRVILTILGVSVGIGAILFLVSLGYGLQKNLLENITTKESLLTLDVIPSEARVVVLNEKTLKKIFEIENVEKVSLQAVFPSQISFENFTSEIIVNLVDQNFFSLAGISVNTGRSFAKNDEQKVVINSSVAELFNLKSDQILGKKVIFSLFLPKDEGTGEWKKQVFEVKKEFEVIGVISESEIPSQVYLNQKDFKELPTMEYQSAKIKVRNDKVIEQVREKLINMGFLVSSLSDIVNQANKIFQVIQIVLGIFGVVALIVAAIGLVNTMTISLLERTNEIGIMRALGASPQDLKRLFLGESFIIGFLGGMGGIGIGILAAEIFNIGINILARSLGGQSVTLFYFPGWFIVFIIFLSSCVGLAAGVWPARRAAKLNPLDALKYK
ncbi:MAG: ABC transporter permease [Nanoarchaeota archaeon]|nr:ABC transporter permease [Nanoarchaeota archaeon]MBU1444777.1 ABC transporter permease [Nanoarchaeota archaeon]